MTASAAPPAPATGPDLTWFRLHAATTVIDFPLRLTHTSSQVWAATMWSDPRAEHGWHLEPWTPGPQGRGFVPLGVELGDVVEFGVNHAPPTRGTRAGRTPDQVQRWHGYLHAIQPDAIVLHGPHPSPEAAYRAAQLAVMAQIHHNAAVTDAEHRFQPPHGRTTQLPTPETTRTPGLAVPGQPPASLSVTFHGQQATVGDPVHGWLLVDADRLLAAMPYPPERLLRLLTPHIAGLTGREPPLTLAALAARHLPDPLPPPPAPDTGIHAPSHPTPPDATPTSHAPNPTNTPTAPTTPATPTPPTGPIPGPGPDPGAEPPIASL